jgi:hypothetical protein
MPRAPMPPPAPREVPRNINFGLAPPLLLGLGIGCAVVGAALLPLSWLDDGNWLWVALPHLLAAPILLFFGVRVRSRRRELARSGHVALARVVAVKAHSGPNESGTTYVDPSQKDVAYAYSVNGASHRGYFLIAAPGPPLGTPLWVIFDPERPARHLHIRL